MHNVIFCTEYVSPLGVLTLASCGKNFCGLWIAGQKYFGGNILKGAVEKNDLPAFDAVKNYLDDYFAGKRPATLEIPLSPSGTEFQLKVWDLLCKIPYGKTTTYSNIAKQIAIKTGKTHIAAQAVGGAVARNPVSIIIPCHRVLAADGSLRGYSGGLVNKIKLLELESM